uniref:Laminin G domain-containing protein n=1 Tax=Musca domestica TaxID=7370 RepID=A0A1I8MES5_MUSDO
MLSLAGSTTTAVEFPLNKRGHRNQSRRKTILRPSPSAPPPPPQPFSSAVAAATSTATAIPSETATSLPPLPFTLNMDSMEDSICPATTTISKSSSLSRNPPLIHHKTLMPNIAIGHRGSTKCTLFRRLHSMFLISLLALILSGCCLTTAAAFQLDGSQNSFAQFRKWYVGLNGSLELEFKTEQPNGLVLYTDDGGTYDFFELKLVEGALRLRYNLGGGAQIITVGRDLHDGHWHKVQQGYNTATTATTTGMAAATWMTKTKQEE